MVNQCKAHVFLPEGSDVGRDEGSFLCGVGISVGKLVGCREGRIDGWHVGCCDGRFVG